MEFDPEAAGKMLLDNKDKVPVHSLFVNLQKRNLET